MMSNKALSGTARLREADHCSKYSATAHYWDSSDQRLTCWLVISWVMDSI